MRSTMKKIIYLLCVIFITACSRTNSIDNIQEHSVAIDRELPNLFLGKPSGIVVIDNYLVIADYMGETLLTIYDLNTDSIVSRAINMGQGPNDLVPPIIIGASHKERAIDVFQRRSSKYSVFLLDELLKGKSRKQNEVELSESDRAISIPHGFLATGYYLDGLFRFFDYNGRVLSTEDVYPPYFQKLKDSGEKYKLGQSLFAYNRHCNVLMSASYFTGEVSFFLVDVKKMTMMQQVLLGDGGIEQKIESLGTNINIDADDIVYCYGAYSTDNNFYVLYSGKTMQEEQKQKQGTYILEFDLKGQLKCRYKFTFPIVDMCITNEKKVYAISQSEDLEYVILSFNLR